MIRIYFYTVEVNMFWRVSSVSVVRKFVLDRLRLSKVKNQFENVKCKPSFSASFHKKTCAGKNTVHNFMRIYQRYPGFFLAGIMASFFIFLLGLG